MIVEREAFNPPFDAVKSVHDVIAEIRATCAVPPHWFDYFASAHAQRIMFDLALIRRELSSSARVLDVGALPLLLTRSLTRAGFQVTGLDIAPERMADAIATMGLDVSRCNVETETLPHSDAYFDAVVFNEVFEHLRINPIETVGELKRVLRVGGQLFLSTPNHLSYLNVRRMLTSGRTMDSGVFDEFGKLRSIGAMGHVREYAPMDVTDFLERMGFRIERLIYRGRYGSNFAQAMVRVCPRMRPYFSVIATRAS